MKCDTGTNPAVLVRELDVGNCVTCGGVVGLGLKEEPTGWKVYRVCLDTDEGCDGRRVGTVSRGSVDHYDDVIDRASQLVENQYRPIS